MKKLSITALFLVLTVVAASVHAVPINIHTPGDPYLPVDNILPPASSGEITLEYTAFLNDPVTYDFLDMTFRAEGDLGIDPNVPNDVLNISIFAASLQSNLYQVFAQVSGINSAGHLAGLPLNAFGQINNGTVNMQVPLDFSLGYDDLLLYIVFGDENFLPVNGEFLVSINAGYGYGDGTDPGNGGGGTDPGNGGTGTVAVPVPATVTLFLLGIAGLAASRQKT